MRTTWMLISMMVVSAAATARGQTVIHYPEDGDPSLQAAITRGSCGSTIVVGPGEFHELAHFPDFADPDFVMPDPCLGGLKLIGSGVGVTILDARGAGGRFTDNPPQVILGVNPALPGAQLVEGFEIAHMTLVGSTLPTDTSGGASCASSIGCQIHDLVFENCGLAVGNGVSATIKDVTVLGAGIVPGQQQPIAITIRDVGGAPVGTWGGTTVQDTTIDNVGIGISVIAQADISLHDIVITRTVRGIRLQATARVDAHHNLIAHNGPTVAGSPGDFLVLNTHDSTFHHNTLCDGAVGIFYAGTPVSFGLGPSSGNQFHHNVLSGVKDLTGVLSGSPQGTNNVAFKNDFDPDGVCPP